VITATFKTTTNNCKTSLSKNMRKRETTKTDLFNKKKLAGRTRKDKNGDDDKN
jgi:hypothetical protein